MPRGVMHLDKLTLHATNLLRMVEFYRGER